MHLRLLIATIAVLLAAAAPASASAPIRTLDAGPNPELVSLAGSQIFVPAGMRVASSAERRAMERAGRVAVGSRFAWMVARGSRVGVVCGRERGAVRGVALRRTGNRWRVDLSAARRVRAAGAACAPTF